MLIFLSVLRSFAGTEEQFIKKINLGIENLVEYCQLKFDVVAGLEVYPGRLVFSHQNRHRIADVILEF